MKVKLTPQTETTMPEYPYLGIHKADLHRCDPLIVMWTEPAIGVVVSQNEPAGQLVVGTLLNGNSRTGHWVCKSPESSFCPYTSTITLSN